MNHRHPIVLSRSNTPTKKDEQVLSLPDEFLYHEDVYGFDLLKLVDTDVAKCYMDDYIVERLSRHSMKVLRKLDIWDEVFLTTYQLDDPQRMVDKWVHSYLRKTAMKKENKAIRLIDKVLKKLY